jgi:hypothetical protein
MSLASRGQRVEQLQDLFVDGAQGGVSPVR